MSRRVLRIVAAVCFALPIYAEVAPSALRLPVEEAWLGERVSFYIELRSPGSFSGSASFDLPEVPGSVLTKIGNPVVGSAKYEGESWFIQTHEFALFSQQEGILQVPPINVRFSRREDFTGPVSEVQAQSPGFKINLKRPAGTDSGSFLVTTESLKVSEVWDPQPGPASVGAVFKRTVTQRASGMLGMALAPVPETVPNGIRLYSGKAETNDKVSRGDFIGERRETVTYLMQSAGTLQLPELTYVWWNPKSETLESTILPAVVFEIAAPPVDKDVPEAGVSNPYWIWIIPTLLVAALIVWQKQGLAASIRKAWKRLNPPSAVAARKLIRACNANQVTTAAASWNLWLNLQGFSYQAPSELASEILELQRHIYGDAPTEQWRGDALSRAFKAALKVSKLHPSVYKCQVLPQLNN